MSNSAINFGGLAGMASIIGSIGNNPSINALSGGGAMTKAIYNLNKDKTR